MVSHFGLAIARQPPSARACPPLEGQRRKRQRTGFRPGRAGRGGLGAFPWALPRADLLPAVGVPEGWRSAECGVGGQRAEDRGRI